MAGFTFFGFNGQSMSSPGMSTKNASAVFTNDRSATDHSLESVFKTSHDTIVPFSAVYRWRPVVEVVIKLKAQ